LDGDKFIEVWNDKELRSYIRQQARRHSKYREVQEDYIQEAWMRIGLCESGASVTFYKIQALRAIQAAYQMTRRKVRYNLTPIECMDREIYEAWQFGGIRKW
jgi:hypothetical protein